MNVGNPQAVGQKRQAVKAVELRLRRSAIPVRAAGGLSDVQDLFSRSVQIQRYKPQVRASSREHFTALNGKRTHTAKMSQLSFSSGVGLTVL